MRETTTLWQRLIERGDRSGWAIVGGLAVLLLCLLAYLVLGENPWHSGVFEKMAAGEELTIHESILTDRWYAAAINAGICVLLLAMSWLWIAPTQAATEFQDRAAGRSWRASDGGSIGVLGGRAKSHSGLWFWPLLIVAVVVAGWIRYPRLDDSFWNHEEQAFRNFTWGSYVIDDSAAADDAVAVKVEGIDWERSLFYTMSGNNHAIHTAGARAADWWWRKAEERPESEFSEAVIRSGPFVAGLLTIALLGVLLRSAGFPLVGVVAAILLALNPWHIRYSVEARGYSELLMWILLANFALGAALETGRWRWWLTFGLCQGLYLLCFPGSVYLAVAQNVIVPVVLVARGAGGSLWRWVVGNAIGAMLVVQMILPALSRIRMWMAEHHEAPFPLDEPHLLDLWSHLVAGMPWVANGAGLHHGVSVADLGAAGPWIYGLALPLLAVLGLLVAISKGGRLAIFIGSAAGAFGLIWLHHQFQELAFFSRYYLYFVIVLVIALAFVTDLMPRREPADSGRDESAAGEGKLAWVAAALLVLLYGFVTWFPRERIRTFDRHPMRQVVELVRGSAPAIDGAQREVMSASIGPGKGQWLSYDPWVQPLDAAADLVRLLETADDEGRSLWVYCSSPEGTRATHGDVVAMLEDGQMFAKGDYVKGLEETWSIQLYRHDPPSARVAPPAPPPPPLPGSGRPYLNRRRVLPRKGRPPIRLGWMIAVPPLQGCRQRPRNEGFFSPLGCVMLEVAHYCSSDHKRRAVKLIRSLNSFLT